MSEIQRSPETNDQPAPLFDDCITEGCGTRYQLTPQNTAGRIYPGQRDCNYLLCVCPGCNGKTRIFAVDNTLEQAALNGIEIFDDEPYAEPEIYDAWCRAAGIELPKTYELTDRHEALIGKFALTMANMPDDLLYDELTSDHGRPHPTRWVD